MRISPEARLLAVFVAFAAAVAVAAWLTFGSGRAFVDAAEHVLDASAPVRADMSSTTGASADADRPRMTQRGATPARTWRELAAGYLAAVERGAAAIGILLVAFFGVAYAIANRALRASAELRAKLERETHHDALTGLPNRRFFAEWLSFAIAHARRERGRVGVLFIDINGCGAVSEFHGRAAADALLVEVARRFRAASREGDVFARLGETEFALATPNAHDSRQLALLAQRLRDQLNESSQPPLADTPIGASIGIAFFPEDANDSAGIMAAANAAMYAARRAGRNHVAFNALAA